MSLYIPETFTQEETKILLKYFSNVDRPVFVLKNLPEVVKGALFARYSRSAKSLRRLFLDEFLNDLPDYDYDQSLKAHTRSTNLYEKVFLEYGDDSIAQLGSAHLACEQVSNLFTKILERSRLMSYLEQSTRYIAYDQRDSLGRYKYFRDPAILNSAFGAKYVGEMDRIFDNYSSLYNELKAFLSKKYSNNDSEDLAIRRAVRAKALDLSRGLLPAGALSNVGIFGSGQSFELMLLRLKASDLDEARNYQEMIHEELEKVIGPFISRVNRPDRGVLWSQYFKDTRSETKRLAELYKDRFYKTINKTSQNQTGAHLIWHDPEGVEKIIASILFESGSVSLQDALEIARSLSTEDKRTLLRSYSGNRKNRRHKPSRAFESANYCFEIISDYGAFRDLQRHRMLSISWLDIDPELGFYMPDDIIEAKLDSLYLETIERSKELYELLKADFGNSSNYALCLAFNIRYRIELNAREAMHLIELRSQPQGHPSYRLIASQMKREIERVGHSLLTEVMDFYSDEQPDLERLEAERKRQEKLLALEK